LEEVIKNERSKKREPPANRRGGHRRNGKPAQKNHLAPSKNAQRGRGGRINKSSPPRASQRGKPALTTNLGNNRQAKGGFSSIAGKRSGPGITTASLRSRMTTSIDPASIVITKNVTPKVLATKNAQSAAKRQNVAQKAAPPAPSAPDNNNSGNRIRGLSTRGFSIRGESGPTVLLVRNLDPGANADDVRTAFLSFGEVLNCDVAVDHSGRSLGEAEVEFANRASALQAIQQLDGELADGRVLRLSLRERGSSVKPTRNLFDQTVRSMISTRNESRLYSDQPNGGTRSSVFRH